MPQQVDWYIPNRIIHVRYQGDVTYADIIGITNATEQLIESGVAPLYFIADLREIEKVSGNPLKNRRNFAFVSHPKIKYVLSCGYLHPMAAFFATTMRHLLQFQFDYKHFQDFEDAMQFLYNLDPTLLKE